MMLFLKFSLSANVFRWGSIIPFSNKWRFNMTVKMMKIDGRSSYVLFIYFAETFASKETEIKVDYVRLLLIRVRINFCDRDDAVFNENFASHIKMCVNDVPMMKLSSFSSILKLFDFSFYYFLSERVR